MRANSEPCDQCGAGLTRPDGAVGTLRCAGCHKQQLSKVAAECRKRRWRSQKTVVGGRQVVRAVSPLGVVNLVDMDDLQFLLADIEQEVGNAA